MSYLQGDKWNEEQIEKLFSNTISFFTLEADKILYGLEGIVSESVKFLILLFIALSLGYADEMLVATIVLLSIRSNSGGLHFSHFFSCLAFTTAFYAAVIGLAQHPLPPKLFSLGLVLALGVFALVDQLLPSCVHVYSPKMYSTILNEWFSYCWYTLPF